MHLSRVEHVCQHVRPAATVASAGDDFASAGFAFPFRLMDGAGVAAVQMETEKLEREHPEEFHEVGQLVNPHLESEVFMQASLHPTAVQLARKALGTHDITLLSTAIFAKYPRKDAAAPKMFVGWHQVSQDISVENEAVLRLLCNPGPLRRT
jgi:hypothetical protein